MKMPELRRHDAIRSDRYSADPAYAAEADRLKIAGAVSVEIVHYRTQHNLLQGEFAQELGWKQPQAARLERGDVAPSLEALERLAKAGALEVRLDRNGTAVTGLEAA